MNLFATLSHRADNKCELCLNPEGLSIYEIPPVTKADENTSLIICQTCRTQIEAPELIDPNHWRCLAESMWSEHAPVQVMAYRMLTHLKDVDWARELFEQLYLDDSLIEFAQAGLPKVEEVDSSAPTLDSHGTRLNEGDSVTLIKDLDVKGAGFTAKRGTLVKNITLTNNPKHIEGRVNGIQIVLIAAYLKKA